MTPRPFLLTLGGLGAAGVAILLWPGTSYAQTTKVPIAPAPVVVGPIAPVTAAVVGVVHLAPVAGPIVTKGADAAPAHPPITIPIVSDVLSARAPHSADKSSAPLAGDRVGSHAGRSMVSPAFSQWLAGAGFGGAVRPKPTTMISAASSRSRAPSSSVALSGLRGVPSGVAADGQAKLRGDAAAASMAFVVGVVAAGWRHFAVTASRAPRPGVARDLSPPG